MTFHLCPEPSQLITSILCTDISALPDSCFRHFASGLHCPALLASCILPRFGQLLQQQFQMKSWDLSNFLCLGFIWCGSLAKKHKKAQGLPAIVAEDTKGRDECAEGETGSLVALGSG